LKLHFARWRNLQARGPITVRKPQLKISLTSPYYFLDLCYLRGAPPYSVKVKVAQDKKEIVPISDSRFVTRGGQTNIRFCPRTERKSSSNSIQQEWIHPTLNSASRNFSAQRVVSTVPLKELRRWRNHVSEMRPAQKRQSKMCIRMATIPNVIYVIQQQSI
jgi:hypothetical protein